MRICLDARWILPEISGIGLYTRELVRALAAIDRSNEYVLLFEHRSLLKRTTEETGLRGAANFDARVVDYGPFSPVNQLRLPGVLSGLRADVYHSTSFMMPLRRTPGTARVVTIHDVIPLVVRDHAPRSLKSRLSPLFRRLMVEVGRRADLIIAVSEATRRDVVAHLHVAPDRRDRVVVIPEGVLADCRPATKAPRSRPVVLYVGRRDPYKNLPRLVEALAMLKARGVQARLRVVGPPDDRYPEAPERARALGVDDDVDWVGYVDFAQLIREYQQADVFCLPSRYEGFGLPVLEAMACGTPVVCGNSSSLPEVAGDAALQVDPDDVEQIAAAIATVLHSPDKAAELTARGLARAAGFTWTRTAQLTLDAYERARQQR